MTSLTTGSRVVWRYCGALGTVIGEIPAAGVVFVQFDSSPMPMMLGTAALKPAPGAGALPSSANVVPFKRYGGELNPTGPEVA